MCSPRSVTESYKERPALLTSATNWWLKKKRDLANDAGSSWKRWCLLFWLLWAWKMQRSSRLKYVFRPFNVNIKCLPTAAIGVILTLSIFCPPPLGCVFALNEYRLFYWLVDWPSRTVVISREKVQRLKKWRERRTTTELSLKHRRWRWRQESTDYCFIE